MKQIIAGLAVLIVGSASAYLVGSNRANKAAELSRIQVEESWQNHVAELESQLKENRSRAGEIPTVKETVEVPVWVTDAPEAIISRLVAIGPAVGSSRNVTLRQIIHELESLRRLGPLALPAIHSFMVRNEDLDYTVATIEPAAGSEAGADDPGQVRGRGRGADGGNDLFQALSSFRGRGGNRSLPSTDFLVPPSLRLGLINVLTEIGGAESEAILAEVLQTTGRGIEVAYVTRALEEIDPGKYSVEAVAAAHELLANPITVDHASRLDDASKRYLYGILYMYEDRSFVNAAQKMVINQEGRIDRTVLSYVNWALGDQSMAALYNIYNDPRLTNRGDVAQIVASTLPYAGLNIQANQVFTDVVSNTETPGMVRAMAVMGLAGGGTGRDGSGEVPTDRSVIQARLNLLENSRQYFGDDERSLRMVDRTAEVLQKLYNGEEVDTSMRAMFGRGGNRSGGPLDRGE
jgi:hypothetical protein